MREQLFQYQEIAEPVQVGAAPEEDVTLDKWLGYLPEPGHRKPSRASFQSFFDPNFPIVAAETITLDKWSPSYPDPQRRRRQLNGGIIVSVEELLTGNAASLLEHTLLATPLPRRRGRQAPDFFFVEAPQAAPGGVEWLTSSIATPARPRKQPKHQSLFFTDIFPVRPPAPDSSGWARELAKPTYRRPTRVQISQTHAFVHAPAFTVVTFTPTQGSSGRPATRNKLFLRLPDLGTLSLRTDRLTGGSKEARLRAPEALQDDYTLVMPEGLPAASQPVLVAADGSMSYGSQQLSGTATWDPDSLNNGDKDSTTVTVTGAAVGDPVYVGFSTALVTGMSLHGAVTSADTVTVTLFNISAGAAQNLASGLLTVIVLKS